MSNSIHVKKIIFYTIGHNGDIHYSREFIKDIMLKIPNIEYEYRIHTSPKLIKDIDNLSVKPFDLNNIYTNEIVFDEFSNILYINTWIGSSNAKHIPNETGCSLKANYSKYKEIYSNLGIPIQSIEYYIPSINWFKYDISNIDSFFNSNNKKMYCLISNGNVLSGQANNVDLNFVVNFLSNKFLNIGFILTNSSNKIVKDNIFYTDDIIKTTDGDLNEIGYLSTKCNFIVGRGSGPFCFCHNKDIINDKSKTLIAFTNLQNDGCWVNPDLHISKAKQIWSNNFDLLQMCSIIENEIRNKNE